MAIKFAGTTNYCWQVYQHDAPVFVGKDRMGDDQYRAALTPIGVVVAKSNADAWDKAHAMCSLPVLEVIGNVQ